MKFFVKPNFSDIFKFKGSSTRKEYWLFYFFFCLSTAGVRYLTEIYNLKIISTFYYFVLLIPMMSISARRFRDIDMSGWNIFLLQIPLLGQLLGLYYFTKASKQHTGNYRLIFSTPERVLFISIYLYSFFPMFLLGLKGVCGSSGLLFYDLVKMGMPWSKLELYSTLSKWVEKLPSLHEKEGQLCAGPLDSFLLSLPFLTNVIIGFIIFIVLKKMTLRVIKKSNLNN